MTRRKLHIPLLLVFNYTRKHCTTAMLLYARGDHSTFLVVIKRFSLQINPPFILDNWLFCHKKCSFRKIIVDHIYVMKIFTQCVLFLREFYYMLKKNHTYTKRILYYFFARVSYREESEKPINIIQPSPPHFLHRARKISTAFLLLSSRALYVISPTGRAGDVVITVAVIVS